jgi:UDP-N-acetyl-D-galactosamine dehydrogenase
MVVTNQSSQLPPKKELMFTSSVRIGVIGLGYVGLPLAVAFAHRYPVIGFDINTRRIADLQQAVDETGEVDAASIEAVLSSKTEGGLQLTCSAETLATANFYIVTVPTPVDEYRKPDLSPLLAAAHTVGKNLKKGDIVVFESTVYPGCTEEACVPVLEQVSGLRYNVDFFAGYSPERINPGDKAHVFTKILKVTSGSTAEAAEFIDRVYASVVEAGTYRASSIAVAEAAKVIENTQRDINVAFVNELAMIFNRIGIDTQEVLQAAGTKWNFLPFQPGLVGGHCIGVDPYYLAQKAQSVGYHPEIILAGRRINDGMGTYVAQEVIRHLILRDKPIKDAAILLLGFTFKENCPDIRNTKVIDIYHALCSYGCRVVIYDPVASNAEIQRSYTVEITDELPLVANQFTAIIHAVAHTAFATIPWEQFKESGTFIYDVKRTLHVGVADVRL